MIYDVRLQRLELDLVSYDRIFRGLTEDCGTGIVVDCGQRGSDSVGRRGGMIYDVRLQRLELDLVSYDRIFRGLNGDCGTGRGG